MDEKIIPASFEAKVNDKKTYIVYKDDIDNFYKKGKKENNDFQNKIRELCLFSIFNNLVPDVWFEEQKWKDLKDSLSSIVYDFGIEPNNLKFMAGRAFNYDFAVKKNDDEIKLEFKFNCSSIKKYPQFLSLASYHFVIDDLYADYFYDNYMDKIQELYNPPFISKNDYLKFVYQSDETKHPFFTFLYSKDKSTNKDDLVKKKEKKKFVDKSIKDYLQIVKLNLSKMNNKFQESQAGKKFILYKSGIFYKDEFENDELCISGINEITKNTIILDTNKPTTKIKMLLRWKNHIGILFPAWQISLCRLEQ